MRCAGWLEPALCPFVSPTSNQPSAAGRLVTVADVKAAITAMLERVRQRRAKRAPAVWPADLNAPVSEVTHG